MEQEIGSVRSLADFEHDPTAMAGLEELKHERGEEELEREEHQKDEEETADHYHKQRTFLLHRATEKIWLEDDKAIYVPGHVNNVAVHTTHVCSTGTLRTPQMDPWFPQDTV